MLDKYDETNKHQTPITVGNISEAIPPSIEKYKEAIKAPQKNKASGIDAILSWRRRVLFGKVFLITKTWNTEQLP